ncbi:MAG: Crp/Fnr family transcriptional regulator [Siphonobacter aquaeclarae]|nr:Crp/Fnr family transcriptional regulator [Siphonobacter aquaeclarae]
MSELRAFFDTLCPLPPDTWERLEPLFSPLTLRKGEYFLTAGALARQIGFLSEGVMRAFYGNDEGEEYNKHFFVPYCLIGGYASLITGQPNQIVQQALTDCRILVADYGQLTALYDTAPELERAARRLAEQFFVNKEEREIELVLCNATERYARFQQQFPGLEQVIPQYHIASYLGITPTQLSRIRRR